MKAKKIAIIYHPNDYISKVSAEKMFNYVVQNLQKQGYKLESIDNSIANFSSNTTIKKMSFSGALLSEKFTHIYVDKNVVNLENGDKFIYEVLTPSILLDDYSSMNNMNKKNRIFIFNSSGEILKL